MRVFRTYEQEQHFLLPLSLSEFVPADHEVRIVSEVVDAMDLSSLVRKYKGGGAPAYHPAMMLKVLIYAYSMGIYSSRRIACELKTDTAFMYLSGLQCPDFRTLCLFRSEHADVLPGLFLEVVRMCASLGMIGLGHLAIDGTKLKANASVRRSLKKDEIEKESERLKGEIREIVQRSAEIDAEEDKEYPDSDGSQMPDELKDKEYRLKKLQKAKEMLEREKQNKVNITDPEARLMRNNHGAIEPAYNGQVAVDDKNQIIVAAAVGQEKVDYNGFRQMLEQVETNLDALPGECSADAGYFSYANLEYASERGIDAYLPDNLLEWLDKQGEDTRRYNKANFHYDSTRDAYICPEGNPLRRKREQKRKGKPPAILYACEQCDKCGVKDKCTHSAARTIWQDGHKRLLYDMREKLRSPEGKKRYLKRMYTVEPVFGAIKWNRGKVVMSLRGMVKVAGEFSLLCLVHNIKKIIVEVRKEGLKLAALNLSHFLPKLELSVI